MIFAVTEVRQIIIVVAWITLGILLFMILYRLFLRRLKRGSIEKELYLVLHPIEKEPASGIVQVFIEMYTPMEVEFTVYSRDGTVNETIENKKFKKGGNIIQLDTRKFKNGSYFYQVKTHNQKTKKLMIIKN